MDYDFVKSKTLLFFFEYLMQKGRPQKLHALTYRFNDTNFTEEMRIIVGGNLAGLKKLFSEHPSLFTIDNDMVDLRTHEPICDYIQETIDYFKQKLLLYGIGSEVPIISLEGHRSQASFRIRHIAGPINKLKQFLSQHPDTFQIIGENVLLLDNFPQRSIERIATQEIGDYNLERQRINDQSDNFIRIHNESVVTSTSNKTEPVSFKMNSQANECAWTVELENLCEDNWPKLYDVWNASNSGVENLMMPSNLNYFIDDKWQEKVLQNTRVIFTVADSVRVTNAILNSIDYTGDQAIVSFDCKASSVQRRSQKKLMLIALGRTCGQVFLFDVLTCPKIMTDGGLKALLESDRVIKIIHECSYKSLQLHQQFEVTLKCVFDTQSANAILRYQNNGTCVDTTEKLSFYRLVKLFYGPLSSMDFVPSKKLWKLWKERPMTQEIIIGAVRDVLLLVDEKLYGSMAISIKPENKSLLSNLCTEQILLLIHPREVRMKIKDRKNDFLTAVVKEKLAQSNKKIVLTKREILSLEYATLTVDEKERIHGNPKLLRKLKNNENIRNETHDEVNVSESEYTSLACSNNIPAATMSSEKVDEAFANVPIGNTELSGTKNCCNCYVDNECQTLCTGDIIIKGLYCSDK